MPKSTKIWGQKTTLVNTSRQGLYPYLKIEIKRMRRVIGRQSNPSRVYGLNKNKEN